MFGEDVQRLKVLLNWPNGTTTMTFEREGNYGDAWHYGQTTLYDTAELTVRAPGILSSLGLGVN